uniref:Uncharacterized protein n=1 Tax=Anguilla anguilla TaxID=7936 RepID=A0A0E9QA95_ANGAN
MAKSYFTTIHTIHFFTTTTSFINCSLHHQAHHTTSLIMSPSVQHLL